MVATTINSSRYKRGKTKPGPLTAENSAPDVWDAFLHRGDPLKLETNKLTRDGRIVGLAERQGHLSAFTCEEVIQEMIIACLTRLDQAGSAGCWRTRYIEHLLAVAEGESLVEVGRRWGISQEQVSREYRPMAARFLAKEFFAELRTQTCPSPSNQE